MRAALRANSWTSLALIGWALVAHARELVITASSVLRTKKPAPLAPVPAGESPPSLPRIWN